MQIHFHRNAAREPEPFAVGGAFFFRFAKRKSACVKAASSVYKKTVVGVNAKRREHFAFALVHRNTHTAITYKIKPYFIFAAFIPAK